MAAPFLIEHTIAISEYAIITTARDNKGIAGLYLITLRGQMERQPVGNALSPRTLRELNRQSEVVWQRADSRRIREMRILLSINGQGVATVANARS